MSGMDIKKELSIVRRTGKFVLGYRQSYLADLSGKARLVVLSRNCPAEKRSEMMVAAKMRGVRVIETEHDSRDVGLALGKPFSASVVAIIDPGSSSLLAGEEVGGEQ
jgi:large subunit ribosomal protein L30e